MDRVGKRVGLRGVLGDLDRRARAVRVPARAATWGFRWDREDLRSRRWWPQGISTSADSAPADAVDSEGLVHGRSLLLTSSYSKLVDGVAMGSRLTFVDITDPSSVRYRHVLLVEPVLLDDGRVDVRPVTVHAGGIVWHGEYVHVAGTAAGFSSFHLGDIIRVPTGDSMRMRIRDASPPTVDTFGHRYVLPVRFTYAGRASAGTHKLRFSFASLDRSTTPHEIVVGEYGRGSQTTRLARFEIDPTTSLLRAEDDGRSHPTLLSDEGIRGMQGAAVVDGTWFVTNSHGTRTRGSLWVGEPGALVERRGVLAVGPEDIASWPQRDELWSVSEHPKQRYVYAMSRAQLLRER